MFLPIPIGGVIAVVLVRCLFPFDVHRKLISPQYVAIYNPRYERKAAELAPNPVPPEFRLEMALIAGPLFAVSFFWFGQVQPTLVCNSEDWWVLPSRWTSYPSISLWAPMLSGVLMGFSISWIFVRSNHPPWRHWYWPYCTTVAESLQLHHWCVFGCRRFCLGFQHRNAQSLRRWLPST